MQIKRYKKQFSPNKLKKNSMKIEISGKFSLNQERDKELGNRYSFGWIEMKKKINSTNKRGRREIF